MNRSWQLLLVGFFIGFITAGSIFLLIKNPRSPGIEILTATPKKSIELNATPTFSLEGGKININTANKDDLMALPGIGEAKASAIIEFRSKYGEFSTIEELLYVPGIGSSLFDSIQDKITIN